MDDNTEDFFPFARLALTKFGAAWSPLEMLSVWHLAFHFGSVEFFGCSECRFTGFTCSEADLTFGRYRIIYSLIAKKQLSKRRCICLLQLRLICCGWSYGRSSSLESQCV